MSCRIKNCPSNQRETSVFRFPKNPEIRRQWINAIESYQAFDYTIKDYSLCMHHFLSTDVIDVDNRHNLKSDAVPCIFEPFKDSGEYSMASTKRGSSDQLGGLTKRIKIEKSASNESINSTGIDALIKPCEVTLLDIGDNLKDLGILMDSNENDSNQTCYKCMQFEQKLNSAYKQIDWMQTKINELTAQINTLKPSSSFETNETTQTVDKMTKCKLCNACIKIIEIEHHVCIDGKSMSCKYCLQTFASTKSFLKHLSDVNHRTWMKRDREAKKFFKCDQCQLAYTMRTLLKCHRKSHEQQVPVAKPSDPVENLNGNVSSSAEKVVTVDIKKIISKPIDTASAHSKNYYKCAVCDMAFDSISLLANHKHVVDAKVSNMEPATKETAQPDKEQPNTEQSIMEPVCQIDIVPKVENVSGETVEQPTPVQEMSTCKLCKKNVLLAQHLCSIYQKSLLCKYCNSRFSTTDSFLKHLSEPDHAAKIKQDRKNKIFYRCNQCKLAYPMRVLLQCHQISHKTEKMEMRNSLHVEKQKRFYKCGKCAAIFEDTSILREHIRKEHSSKRMYECYICKTQIHRHVDALRIHMKTHFNSNQSVCRFCRGEYDKTYSHLCGGETTIQCDYCDQVFTTTVQLITHLGDAHEQKKLYQCDKCLKYHPMLFLKKHHYCNGEQVTKPFACSICSKKFAHYFKLQIHEKSHDEPGQYLCDECGKTFHSATNFKHHQMSSIHNEPTFHCTECPNKYYKESKLKCHLEKHRGITYVCEICKREFISKQSHRRHMAIHNRTEADRRFECEICSKKFFTTKILKKHYTVHYGDNSFKCRFCDAAYKYKGDLNKHLRSHLDGKIHECDKCPLSFYYPDELQKHLNEHFKEERNQLNCNYQATI